MKNSREVAFFILNEYLTNKANLNSIIDKYLKVSQFSELDKRFINTLSKGTVRFLYKIDYVISIFSNIKIEKIDFVVLNILRQAVYQYMFLSRVPTYSIVDESVKIAKKYAGISSSKFVNAVLRKILSYENLNDLVEEKINKSNFTLSKKLSTKYSFPEWLAKYWIEMFGSLIAEKLMQKLNDTPLIYARVNRLKTDKDYLIKLLLKNELVENKDFYSLRNDSIESKIFSDNIALKSAQNIENLPGYIDGYFFIQDFSSQIAVKYYLEPKAYEKILDLCGAPGGKATYMNEITMGKCEIISVDMNKEKLNYFLMNIKRLGAQNIKIVNSNILNNDFLFNGKNVLNFNNFSKKDYFKNYFDKIFIDIPCSALGTISKNPDVKYNKSFSLIKRLSEDSLQMLNNCDFYLKRGGLIVFYTCTLSKIENQEVIKKFLKSCSSRYDIEFKGIPKNLIEFCKKKGSEILFYDNCKIGYFEIMPFYFNSEGGFICVLKKK